MLQRHMRLVGSEVLDTALKVAFATSDMKTVNQHFGSASSFAIYAVDQDSAQLLEVAQFGHLAQDGNEDKLVVKINTLAGCSAVYSQAIGSSAIRQLLGHGIQPVRVDADSSIQGLIEALQQEIKKGPSAWLAKAILQAKGPQKDGGKDRFDAMEDEGWSE